MQSFTERYLKEKVYPVSIVQSREFHNSQEILNVKAIFLRQQGRGKRPNKSEWDKMQWGTKSMASCLMTEQEDYEPQHEKN